MLPLSATVARFVRLCLSDDFTASNKNTHDVALMTRISIGCVVAKLHPDEDKVTDDKNLNAFSLSLSLF